MRKTILLATLLCSIVAVAQNKTIKKDAKYRRSSLYTVMIKDSAVLSPEEDIMVETFKSIPIPDKYNNHCLGVRCLDIFDEEFTPTEDELKTCSELTGKSVKKKGFGLGKLTKMASSLTGQDNQAQADDKTKTAKLSDNEYIARITKYFDKNHTANKLVAMWYDGLKVEDGKESYNNFNGSYNLIKERGFNNASKEELDKANLVKGGKDKILSNATMELIPNTFVMVTRYSYLSAEDIAALVTAAANTGVVGMLGGAVGQYAAMGASLIASTIKGYFVKTSSYLFQLDWDKDKQDLFEKQYNQKHAKDFIEKGDFKLKYVGKTWDYAPATLKVDLTGKAPIDTALIARATYRATDGSIAKLQQKYDAFKTMSPLHISNDTIYAYIGKKEGVKSGDKFEVFELSMKDDGTTEYKKTGSISVMKGMVWDNRYGTNIKSANDDDDNNKKDKEEEANPNLTYTVFKGNAKSLSEGMLIRQVK